MIHLGFFPFTVAFFSMHISCRNCIYYYYYSGYNQIYHLDIINQTVVGHPSGCLPGLQPGYWKQIKGCTVHNIILGVFIYLFNVKFTLRVET